VVALGVACSPAAVITSSSPAEVRANQPARIASSAATAPRVATPARVGPTPASAPRQDQHPSGSPYAAGAHGYDASYPQCPDQHPPEDSRFAVVGVNAGKAFTRNDCLGELWRGARPPDRRAVYMNSGYNPDNLIYVADGCKKVSRTLQGSTAELDAYAIGCGEGVHSLALMSQDRVGQPLVCWVDVERSNSWDEQDLNLNRFALQGLFDQLAAHGCRVGVYSTYTEWEEITGNWLTSAVAGDWVALARPDEACGLMGFSGAPVWIVQELATWDQADYDSDYAC
jgi:hypothetical protein